MAVRTESIQVFSCDLCGQDSDEADLTRVYSALQAGKRLQVDVCPDCQKRPIADLVNWFTLRRQEVALRPVRRLRGVGR
ncbi:MAG: hypothetical protein LBV34_10645 [Nocardiopsaceae bacterium]|jgi:NAD-dependent SIR2 family protein deacetylase|nr:hypothetical protein [Nocardiopsaceae bacterium]